MPLDVKANDLVSVIIPCYNGEAYLSDAIESVLAQTYKPIELIVVDDGSWDHSSEIIKSYGNALAAIKQENRGLSEARNAGIRKSHGDYYAFLDADDYWDSDFVAKMLIALKRSCADISYCGWQNVGLSGKRGDPFIPPDYEHKKDKLELLIRDVRWPVHCAMMSKKVLDLSNGFEKKWKYCEDFAFWIKVATTNSLVLVPEVLGFYRFHGNQMTTKSALVAESAWRVQKEYLRQHPDVTDKLGCEKIKEITDGNLLRKAYDAYWKSDIDGARHLFRLVAGTGYASIHDWKYIVAAHLPRSVHAGLVSMLRGR